MYEQHFGLTERPFSIAPDPRFLFMSQCHREALAHLLYGVGEAGGFVQLTGEVGTGKTTVCRCLLEQLPDNVDVALILNPRVSGVELIASLCDELRIAYPPGTDSTKALIDLLNRYLLESHARGRRTVMVIDEAQNLDSDALEQVRLLTNLETTREKLLQIILIGQPELRDLLARDELRQLSQRITARYHLQPIRSEDTGAYIKHRMQVCGATENLFTDGAVKRIKRYSKGIPRIINVLCDRALLGAYVEGKRQVTGRIVRRAAAEVLPREAIKRRSTAGWWAAAMLGVGLMLGALLLWQWPHIEALFGGPRSAPPVARAPAPDRQTAAADADAKPEPPKPDAVAATVVEQPAEPAVEAKVELDALLTGAGPTAAARAWAGLFRLWGYDSSAASDDQACEEAVRVQLRCVQKAGNWTVLMQYDRPALLLLSAPDGRWVPALMATVSDGSVDLEVDGVVGRFTRAEVERYWQGRYRLLWRVTPGGRTALFQGQSGSDVGWLREHLEAIMGEQLEGSPTFYSVALTELVRRFQLKQGLLPDGVAGPDTLIALNTLIDREGVPRLLHTTRAATLPKKDS